MGVLAIIAGATAALGNILPRLIYQKMHSYGIESQGYENELGVKDKGKLIATSVRLTLRLLNNLMNPSGFLFFILLAATLFNFIDLFLYCYACLLLALIAVSTRRFLLVVQQFDANKTVNHQTNT
jgi:hypothetical protein